MPQKGVVDSEALKRYGQIVKKLMDNKITPICTLLHFTLPSWLEGGLESKEFTKYFLLFIKQILKVFKNRVKHYITYNEPMLWLVNSYLRGVRPPGKKLDWDALVIALKTIAHSHTKAYNLLHNNVS